MHRDTPNNETVIVEYGFLDSTGDDVNQLKNNWEQLAEAVVKATVEYAGGTYTPVEGAGLYTVVAGDSLYSIANRYNTTVSELKLLNNLTNDLLTIGQVLKIPGNYDPETPTDPSPPVTSDYTVISGDNLYSIARKFNTSVSELKSLNNLNSDILSIGQVLKIPGIIEPEEPDIKPSPEGTYTVVSGDSLYSIAKKFNTTVDELKRLNNLSSTLLNIGQVLIVPSNDLIPEENYKIYTVVAGDSLYRIALKNNTTVDEIKKINNLTSDTLSIGQQLKLPGDNSVKEYIVVSGDSLYSIARKFNTTVDEIKSLNNLTSDILSIGQKLLIP